MPDAAPRNSPPPQWVHNAQQARDCTRAAVLMRNVLDAVTTNADDRLYTCSYTVAGGEPCAAPAVLDLVAAELVRRGFDVRKKLPTTLEVSWAQSPDLEPVLTTVERIDHP